MKVIRGLSNGDIIDDLEWRLTPKMTRFGRLHLDPLLHLWLNHVHFLHISYNVFANSSFQLSVRRDMVHFIQELQNFCLELLFHYKLSYDWIVWNFFPITILMLRHCTKLWLLTKMYILLWKCGPNLLSKCRKCDMVFAPFTQILING